MHPVVAVLLLVALVVVVAYDGVIDLSNDNYQQEVMEDGMAILVAYDGPKVGSASEKIFSELGDKLDSFGIRSGYVDCSNEGGNRKICLGASLKAVPSFHLFLETPTLNPYTKKLLRSPVVHLGRTNTIKSIETFISKSFSPFITHIDRVSDYEDFSKNTTSPIVIYVTHHAGSSIPMIAKSMAYKFKNKIKFLHVSNATEDLVSHLSAGSSPRLLALVNGEMRMYEGASLNDRGEVQLWISSFSPPDTADSEASQSVDEEAVISSRHALEGKFSSYLHMKFPCFKSFSTDLHM